MITIFQAWAVRAELHYSGKIEIQKRPALFQNPQSFVDCSMERSIRYNFFHWFGEHSTYDYSLNIYFSRRFPYIDSPSFSPYKPLQNVDFSKVGNMQVFFRNCTHILTRTQGKKFEDMFLVKIASKRTSLIVDLNTTILFEFILRLVRHQEKTKLHGEPTMYCSPDYSKCLKHPV